MIVTRRTALKVIGGCLIVPSLKVRPEHDLHKIVQDFCDTETSRWDLMTPWVADGQAYGTDGRAAARIASDDADTDTDERSLPRNITGVWESHWTEQGVWRPLPPERLIEGEGRCPDCCEVAMTDCENCDGEGFGFDDEGFTVPCPKCKGEGSFSDKDCPRCHGRGWGDYPNLQPFGNKLICVAFMRKLQRIPGAMWNIGNPDKRTPILVKSDIGVESLVMPVVPEAGKRSWPN